MATMDYRNHVNMNPKSPDRKLPVQSMIITPDRTVTTTESNLSETSNNNMGLGQEVDGLITVVKHYVQASKGYSPTRREFERTMEAIEARAEEEEALARQHEAEIARREAEKAAQEVGFMGSLYSTFSFASEDPSSVQHSTTASQRGTVVHQMLKRLVVKELQSRRDKSATVIQSTVRRVLAQKRKQEMRVIAVERMRALKELESQQKYEEFSRKAAARDYERNANSSLVDDEEVAGEIKTSKFSKMKTALKTLKKNKKAKSKNKKTVSKAPLLPSMPESSPHGGEDANDMPIQENSSRKNKFWNKVKKLKVKRNKKKKKKRRSLRYPSRNAPILDGIVEEGEEPAGVFEPAPAPEPRRMTVTITTTDDSIPTPEAEAEALEYHRQRSRGRGVPEDAATEAASSYQSHGDPSTMRSSLPSGNHFGGSGNWNSFVLADDATSMTSGRTRPLLDSWFNGFMFDKETLRECDDDAIEEMVELAFTDRELQNDLKIIPEMNWTEDDWADTKESLFRCSQDHIEEVTYQTKRFVSNEVTL
ncbi:unnamed protein product [Cylindrotheca closterium]|uniref:Uncharacterized protein n=1 Tax=Cylindrotheca closterium TaxID=2856 RepID=A0AAD2FQ75_9STRA|nr:unnamed protein product [Cylindrotheca closterium]